MDESFSLQVWRALGRHDELQPALEAALAAARPRLPVELAAIRYLVPEHRLWETVAIAGDGPTEGFAGVDRVAEGAEPSLPRTLRRERVLQVEARGFSRAHPGVLPHAARGPLVLAAIDDEPRLTGLLVLAGLNAPALAPAARDTVLALVEPLTSALRHFAWQRDATALREVAEADRRSLLNRLGRTDISDAVVGADSGLRDVMERVAQVARADAPVLLLGETGSGKEVIARAIHRRSGRASGPFVRVNCGAIPGELVDSELFGHERGSFTGAVAQRRGWFERADGGTLFLDEVAELPLQAQVRLLRVLQDGLRAAGRRRAVDRRERARRRGDPSGSARDDPGRPLSRGSLVPAGGVSDRIAGAARTRGRRSGAVAALRAAGCRQAGTRAVHAGRRRHSPALQLRLAGQHPRAVFGDRAGGDPRQWTTAGGGESAGHRRRAGVGVATDADRAARRSASRSGEFTTFDEQARSHIEAALRKSLGRVDGPFGAALLLGLNPQTLRSRMRKLGIDSRRFRPPR